MSTPTPARPDLLRLVTHFTEHPLPVADLPDYLQRYARREVHSPTPEQRAEVEARYRHALATLPERLPPITLADLPDAWLRCIPLTLGPDLAAIMRTLDLLCHAPAPVEVRIKIAAGPMRVQRFTDRRQAAEWVMTYPQAAGAYVVMNPYDVQRIKGDAVNDDAITARHWLLIDADPDREPDTNATIEEIARAKAVIQAVKSYLNTCQWPAPVEADSGNGKHLLYRVDLPNDEDAKAVINGVLIYLDRTFSRDGAKIDVKVGNASRITKLYGTVARKGSALADRPHRLSGITYVPDVLQPVALPDLRRVADQSPDGKSDKKLLPEEIIDGGRNDALFKEGCRLRHLGLAQPEILAALIVINQRRCRPALDIREVETIAASCARYELSGTDTLHPLTEAGDAESFADLYRDVVRYDHRQGRWLVTDEQSGIWVPDPVERLTQMAIETARVRQRHALTLKDDLKKKAMTWAIGGEARKRLTNTLALARSVPPIADAGEHWDENPFLLGVQNGVVDLETGRFRKAAAADRVTMRVRVAYDPSATCPLWLSTFKGIFEPADLFTAEDSRLMIAFMQRALGYSITGDCREECCFFAWGEGGNGKGTLMNTLGWLFGDYTDDMPYSTLEQSKYGSGIPNDIAKLDGKRFITCSEVNEFNLNEARLKALTGRDPMTARFLNREFFTFIPVCKIWIATNNKPKIIGQDDGIWRRIHLIPFTQKFEGRENKQLKDQLRGELPGILNWIIEGAGLWLRDGLNPPDTVKVATAAYRKETNPITPFIDACCVVDPKARMQAVQAFAAYEQFCRDGGIEVWLRLSDKAFHKAMRQAFKADKGRQTFYLGVGLRAAGPGEPTDDKHFADQDEPPF